MKKYIVYVHTAPNNKVYVGVTCQSPNDRWCSGFGYKENEHFFRAIVKYGWDNFKHEIVAKDLDDESAFALEKTLIKKYRSNQYQYGYNRSAGGRYPSEGCHTKRKVVRHKRTPKGVNAYASKPVCQFTLDGKLKKVYGSGTLAAKAIGVSTATQISKCCLFKGITAYGHFWLFEDEQDRLEEKMNTLTKEKRAYLSRGYWQKMSKIQKERQSERK